jgi:hypothetical protein
MSECISLPYNFNLYNDVGTIIAQFMLFFFSIAVEMIRFETLTALQQQGVRFIRELTALDALV